MLVFHLTKLQNCNIITITKVSMTKKEQLQFYRQNISPLVRKVTKNNIKFLVVPMVMMLEQCVMNKVLYIRDAVNASSEEWNGRNIVIYHPKTTGVSISANNPETFTAQNIGTIFNSKIADNKLKAEAWIEVAKLENLEDGKKLIDMLEANKNIDVSTGMRIVGYEENGTYKGSEYTIVANQIIPDHLAILLDETGACSWSDGAGFARNNKDTALDNQGLNQNKELSKMDRHGKVGALIKSGVITENQRKSFEEMADGDFDSFESLATQNAKQTVTITEHEATIKTAENAKKEPKKKPAENTENKVLQGKIDSLEDFKANAEKKEKQSHVDAIIANKDNKFTEDQLFAMPAENLANIVGMLKTADYSANGNGVRINQSEPTENELYMQNAGNQPKTKED